MPTFTSITLDRLLEPRASISVEKSVPGGKLMNSKPPIYKMEKSSAKPAKERTGIRPQMSPALYATPDAIPLPDSPSSFPPSPYIINHKARGPRILKSFSEDLSSRRTVLNEQYGDADMKGANLRKSTSVTFSIPEPIKEDHSNVVHNLPTEENNLNGIHDGTHDGELGGENVKPGSSNRRLGSNDVSCGLERENNLSIPVAVKGIRDSGHEEFDYPGESMSFASKTELEDDAGAESSQKESTTVGEFFDACEELSSDSGMQTSVTRNVEAELREIRLSLLMEIEKRKQAEEALNHMQTHWQRIREQLAHVGLTLPADPIVKADGEEPIINVAEELRIQFEVARFVSDSIGRGIAKAEVKEEMQAKLEAKNFEVARLSDKLNYYEVVNREMSQRNQEAIEAARRDRQRRKRRQRWVWGSIAATIALGSTALAWSYLPSGKSSSSSPGISQAQAPPEIDE